MAIEDTVKKYFECVNEENFEALYGLFCDDADLSSPVGIRAQGLEEIKAFYSNVLTAYPEHVDAPLHILVQGDMAAVLIDFKGRSDTGTDVSFIAADWFTFENEKIKTIKIFYDSMALIRTLKKGE